MKIKYESPAVDVLPMTEGSVVCTSVNDSGNEELTYEEWTIE